MDVPACVRIGRSQSMDHGSHHRSTASTDKEIRIAVLGDQGVGKSALVVRFLTKRYIGEYAHQERFCVHHSVIDGKPAKLHILDTSGGDDDRRQLQEHLMWADGFLLVYSVSDMHSFYNISSLADLIHSCRGSVPCLLLANKVDLPPEARKITELQGRRLSGHLSCSYVETSAQENYSSVVHAFTALIQEIRMAQKQERLNKITKKPHSTISQLRETLRNLTDFRHRTNTF